MARSAVRTISPRAEPTCNVILVSASPSIHSARIVFPQPTSLQGCSWLPHCQPPTALAPGSFAPQLVMGKENLSLLLALQSWA